MKVTTKELYKYSYGEYALAAVNVAFMEQVLALFAAADVNKRPVIVQTTSVQRKYSHPKMILAIIEAAAEIYPDVIHAIHLDHGEEKDLISAIQSGKYTSVMIDASHDPFEENIRRTTEIVKRAHDHGISVEAELGVLAGVEDGLATGEERSFYTDPDQVAEFVAKTNCDSLAIAVGTSHGAYKFSGGQGLQFHILEEIQNRLPNYPLVLHGGSGINPEEIRRINNAGGQIHASAKGVGDDEIRKSIEYGVCKVNLATDLRLLWTRVTREYFKKFPDRFMPILPGATHMEEYQKFMKGKFELYNSTGKAPTLKSSLK